MTNPDTIAVIVGEMQSLSRLGYGNAAIANKISELADRLAALGDLEKDAARYRHLRKDGVIWRVNMLALAKDDIDILFGETADAAIDAAMAESKSVEQIFDPSC